MLSCLYPEIVQCWVKISVCLLLSALSDSLAQFFFGILPWKLESGQALISKIVVNTADFTRLWCLSPAKKLFLCFSDFSSVGDACALSIHWSICLFYTIVCLLLLFILSVTLPILSCFCHSDLDCCFILSFISLTDWQHTLCQTDCQTNEK